MYQVDCLSYSMSGVTVRSAGLLLDGRLNDYCGFGTLEMALFLGSSGDSLDRC